MKIFGNPYGGSRIGDRATPRVQLPRSHRRRRGECSAGIGALFRVIVGRAIGDIFPTAFIEEAAAVFWGCWAAPFQRLPVETAFPFRPPSNIWRSGASRDSAHSYSAWVAGSTSEIARHRTRWPLSRLSVDGKRWRVRPQMIQAGADSRLTAIEPPRSHFPVHFRRRKVPLGRYCPNRREPGKYDPSRAGDGVPPGRPGCGHGDRGVPPGFAGGAAWRPALVGCACSAGIGPRSIGGPGHDKVRRSESRSPTLSPRSSGRCAPTSCLVRRKRSPGPGSPTFSRQRDRSSTALRCAARPGFVEVVFEAF